MMIPGAVAGGHKYPPVVSTNSITPVSTEYAQLTFSGRIERAGNSDNTSVLFHYGTSPTLASYSATPSLPTVTNGTNNLDVFYTQTSLNPDNAGTTYHYRVVSTNLGGTVLGDIKSATVPVRPPTVTTNAGVDSTVIPTATTTNQSGISRFSATLNGTATNATRCYFQYVSGITEYSGYTASVTSPSIAVSLSSGVTYTYRLIAENNSPQVTFNGTVNPNNRSTTVLFRYATTEAGVASGATIAGNVPTTNTSAQAITATISLSAGTYYYRVEAINDAGGTSVGTPLSITIANKSVTSGTAKTFTTYVVRSQYFSTPGPATWSYPAIPTGGSQINTVSVVLAGGGGGGARGAGKYAGNPYYLAYAGAGGGGGGRRVEGVLTINGNSATLDVGEGGQGASVANGAKSGFNGATSTITCSATGSSFSALGGIGGVSAFLGAPNGGNSGVTQPGGAGYDAITYGYSLGGGGAGNNGAGDSATTNAAGKGGPGIYSQCGGGGGAGIYFSSGYLATAAEGRDGGGNGGVAGGNNATAEGGGGGGGASGSGGDGYRGFVYVQWEGP